MQWSIDLAEIPDFVSAADSLLTTEGEHAAILDRCIEGNAGGAFDTFGREKHGADEIGCHDLLSLAFLSDRPSGLLARDLLSETDLKTAVDGLLGDIDDINLWESPARNLDQANDLWSVLKAHPSVPGQHMGDARLSKLLSRKRPRLIPITDSYVRSALPLPRGIDYWSAFRSYLQGRETSVHHLEELSAAHSISPLRAFDILVWTSVANGEAGEG